MENFVPTLKRFIVNLILFLGGVGFVVAGIQYVNYLTGDKSYGIIGLLTVFCVWFVWQMSASQIDREKFDSK